MTVGRYYTPAGRLIQTPYEKGEMKEYYKTKSRSWQDAVYDVEQYREDIPDSLVYETDHGRTVFGGGDILPDYVIAPDTTSLSTFGRKSQLDAIFAREWFSRPEKELRSRWQDRASEFLSSYDVPDEAISSFWGYAESEGMIALTSAPDSVRPKDRIFPKSEADSLRSLVRTRLKGRLANVLYGTGTGQSLLNQTDPIFDKAMSLWPSSMELAGYHAASSPLKKN
jgi:carboxyl-terminal processing protease